MSRRLVAFVAIVVATLLVAAPAARAGDDKAGKPGGAVGPAAGKGARDAEAADYLRGLLATRHGQTEEQAVASVTKLVNYWKDTNVSDATKQTIPGVVAWYAKRDSDAVVLAAINGLAVIGRGPGTQRLVTILEGLVQQKDPPAEQVAAAFKGLQSAADPEPAITGAVLRLLTHKDKKIVLQAITSVGAYSAATVPIRRRLFEDSLGTFETMASAAARAKANAPAAPAGAPGEKPAAPPADKPADGASAAPADPAAVKSADTLAIEKWAAVERAAVAMLGSLSRQQFADLPAARTWLAHGGRAPDAWK